MPDRRRGRSRGAAPLRWSRSRRCRASPSGSRGWPSARSSPIRSSCRSSSSRRSRRSAKKALRLAIFSDRDDLHFFAPVVVQSGRILGGRSFSVWAHPYAPLGTPLIDRDMAPQVTDALIAHMRTSGRTLFSIPHLPLKGPTAEALRAAAERSGFWTIAERQMRPILYPDMAGGLADFDRMVNSEAAARARPPAAPALRGGRRQLHVGAHGDGDRERLQHVHRARGVRLEGPARHGACAAARACRISPARR